MCYAGFVPARICPKLFLPCTVFSQIEHMDCTGVSAIILSNHALFSFPPPTKICEIIHICAYLLITDGNDIGLYKFLMEHYIKNNACTRVTNCFSAHKRIVLEIINKYQNNAQVRAESVRYESTYIILFLTRHNESINDDKNDDLYTFFTSRTRLVFVLLMTSQSIADDVTMTSQLWRNHVNSGI